jgi:hypothetical protein
MNDLILNKMWVLDILEVGVCIIPSRQSLIYGLVILRLKYDYDNTISLHFQK